MRIGEVSEVSGVSVRMLRHYDRTGLLRPSHRTSTDYRDYSATNLDRLFRIEALRSLGLTLAEVGEALDDPTMDASTVLDRLRQESRDRIHAEQELLDRLTDVSDTGPATWEDALHITAMLTALREGSSRQRQATALHLAALQTPDRQPVAALVASYLEEPDENAAGTLRWALVRSGKDAVPALAAAAGGPEDMRRRIVDALACIHGEKSTAALECFLDDRPDISGPAALALARRGVHTTGLIDTLVRMVADGNHDTDAADALGVIAREHVPPDRVNAALLCSADGSPTPVRLRIVQALGDLPDACSALGQFTADPDPTVARTAGYLLER
ncbi:MerR family transcriptional regulator [Corynebacterium variabile]|uniref:MerR family transcriptional regulator n=1 Tax=Corynebacterium variabile TaxID=1727 RepID=UPI003A94AAB9